MALKYALFPGCAANGATPELYQSTMAIIDRLGIDVVELEADSCCGAGVIAELRVVPDDGHYLRSLTGDALMRELEQIR